MGQHRIPKSDKKKYRALQMVEDGVPYSQIAEQLEVSKGSVSNWARSKPLRDRWQRWKGEQRVREQVKVESKPPAAQEPPSEGAEVVDMSAWESSQPCALGPRIMRKLLISISDGNVDRLGLRSFDFSVAAMDAGLLPEELDAVAFAASRGEPDAVGTMRRLNMAAASVIAEARKALKEGDDKREAVRLFLLEVHRFCRPEGVADAGAPLSRFSDEDLDVLEASIEQA